MQDIYKYISLSFSLYVCMYVIYMCWLSIKRILDDWFFVRWWKWNKNLTKLNLFLYIKKFFFLLLTTKKVQSCWCTSYAMFYPSKDVIANLRWLCLNRQAIRFFIHERANGKDSDSDHLWSHYIRFHLV